MIPGLYVFAGVGIVAGALGFAGGWSAQGWRLGEQIATIKASQLEAVNTATREARATESRRVSTVQEAQNAATKRAQAARADADRARSDLERLRDAIRARPVCVSSDTAGAGIERTDPAGILLAECGQALTELASKADRHAADAVMLLEAWPR